MQAVIPFLENVQLPRDVAVLVSQYICKYEHLALYLIHTIPEYTDSNPSWNRYICRSCKDQPIVHFSSTSGICKRCFTIFIGFHTSTSLRTLFKHHNAGDEFFYYIPTSYCCTANKDNSSYRSVQLTTLCDGCGECAVRWSQCEAHIQAATVFCLSCQSSDWYKARYPKAKNLLK